LWEQAECVDAIEKSSTLANVRLWTPSLNGCKRFIATFQKMLSRW
jgi:hypothetical protein